jgi:hypothetical protein
MYTLPASINMLLSQVGEQVLMVIVTITSLGTTGHLVALRRGAIGEARADKAWDVDELVDKLYAAIRWVLEEPCRCCNIVADCTDIAGRARHAIAFGAG